MVLTSAEKALLQHNKETITKERDQTVSRLAELETLLSAITKSLDASTSTEEPQSVS